MIGYSFIISIFIIIIIKSRPYDYSIILGSDVPDTTTVSRQKIVKKIIWTMNRYQYKSNLIYIRKKY
jgi:hypothetical protein